MSWKIPSIPNLFRNSYLLAFPTAGISGASVYSICVNHNLVSSVEDDFLSRVSFIKPSSSQKIEEDNIDFSQDSKLKELIRKDSQRLSDFYRNYYSKPIYVNTPVNTPNQTIDFFIHSRNRSDSYNKNNVWLDNVHLNQLSIDRYGLEYDDKGAKKSNSTAKLVSLVKWHDIAVSEIGNETLVPGLPALSLNFFNNDISKEEIDILVNEDDNKYKLEGSEEGISKDWFVWLDKDLLTLKLNYALQTWVFNQDGARNETSISGVIGSGDSTSSDEQKRRKKEAEENYKYLPESYKQFAKDYISSFLDTSSSNGHVSNWSSVTNTVTTVSNFIKTDDLNKIYNKFHNTSKSLELFKPHLISKITSGKVGNWKVSLNLKKEKKSEQEGMVQEYESKKISKIDSNSDLDVKKKNALYIISDPATNNKINLREILDKVKNYSVRNFSLSYNNITFPVTSSYSQTNSDKTKEALHVLHIQHTNNLGIYMSEKWLPIILGAIFISGIICYLAISFKVPGVLVGGGIFVSAVNVMGLFFALGAKLSLVGIIAILAGILFSLFLGYYFLNFLKKIFCLEYLDKSNIWALFKRGLVMSTDISLPIFVMSSFISFLAPLDFREFGIILSLFVLSSYVFVTLVSFLMTLQFSSDMFSKMLNKLSGGEAKDFFLDQLSEFSDNTSFRIFSLGKGLIVCIVALILWFVLGFDSFSFLKQNYLLTFSDDSWALKSGSNASDVDSTQISTQLANINYRDMGSSGDTKSYLISGYADFNSINTFLNSKLNDGAYHITSTSAFSDYFSVQDLSKAIGYSFILICVYLLIRFKIKNLVIFIVNTTLSTVLFMSLLILSRIPINTVFLSAVCTFFVMSIIYQILLFSFDRIDYSSVYSSIIKDIQRNFYIKVRFSILIVISLMLCSISSPLFITFVYLSTALSLSYFLTTFIYLFLSKSVTTFQNKYSWTMPLTNYESEEIKKQEDYLVEQDEEEILGINRNI